MPRWCQYFPDAAASAPRLGRIEGDAVLPMHGNVFDAPQACDEPACALQGLRLAPPCRPASFVGLWNNFYAMAQKMGWAVPAEPLYFLKAASCLAGPGAVVRAPAGYDGKVFYEGELGIVIGRHCARASEAEARAAIFGYTCVNDVTAFDLLNRDPAFAQWTRAKSCDGFGVIGPWIDTDFDPAQAALVTRVNGRERQNYALADMIFPPVEIVRRLSQEMTLAPGDVIACGTSLGALPMKPGSVLEIEISGLGVLRHEYEPQPEEA